MLATTRIQSLWGAAAVVALAFVTGSRADAQSTVTGRWEILLSTQVGDSTWVAAFQQDGVRLSGEIDLGNREIFPLQGTVDDGSITFEFIVSDPDGDQPVTLTGEVLGDRIEGAEGNFIWFGSGAWTGTRQGS